VVRILHSTPPKNVLLLLPLCTAAVLLAPFAGAERTPSGEAGRTRRVTGRVLDRDGHPIEGATVRIKGSRHWTRSDGQGTFALELPAGRKPPLRITAAAEGYYIQGRDWDGSNPVVFRLEAVPREIDERYRWVDPGPSRARPRACANCHPTIYAEWVSSAHATSAVNKHFLDVFYGVGARGDTPPKWALVRDRPDGRGVCAPCHVPQASFGSLALADPARASGTEREGVHCDVCHKVRALATEVFGLTHGLHAYELSLPPPPKQVFFGPLDDVDRGEDAFAAVYKDARFCAPCHEGTVLGTRAYTTYTEYTQWLTEGEYRAGRTCQSCHMAPDGKKTNIAPGHGGIERDPATLSTHAFAGRTLEMLREAIRIKVEADRTSRTELEVRVQIAVRDTGHRVPTGFPQRHLVLLVQAVDPSGTPCPLRKGSTLPDLVGTSATVDQNLGGQPGAFYGRILADAMGLAPTPYWLATQQLQDSRLWPDRTQVERFVFGVRKGSPVRVRVYLLYRKFFPALEQEKGWEPSERLVYRKEFVVR